MKKGQKVISIVNKWYISPIIQIAFQGEVPDLEICIWLNKKEKCIVFGESGLNWTELNSFKQSACNDIFYTFIIDKCN